MTKKIVIINRAVPGSGKTTITNCIVDELKNNNIRVAIHSTDRYFMLRNKYVFDIKKLFEYHQKNVKEFITSIDNKLDVVICDNTNIAPWQTEEYTKIARANNYQILFITLNPRELSKHIESQKVTLQKPDAHEVSEEILNNMIKEYYIYDDLLNSKILIDENKHVQYKWDVDKNMKTIVGTAKHFDSDFIIRIFPDEYEEAQKHIGSRILKLIKGEK